MGTRLATIADVGRIVHFLKKYHEEDSNLKDIPFDRRSMVKCTEYHITQPKHACFVYIDDDKLLRGVLMCSIEPFMFNEKRKWATDILNVADAGGAWLVKRFISWAKHHRVDRIIMGVSTGNTRVDELYKAVGFENTGGMYMMSPKSRREDKDELR